jgi:hypothetical protein
MPPSASTHLKSIAEAILEDTKKQQHQEDLKKMRDTEREIELLDQATRMAQAQTARSMQRSAFINNMGYECAYCRQNPVFCICGGRRII